MCHMPQTNSSSSTIMSLKDLARHIGIQNKTIKQLPAEGIDSKYLVCKLWITSEKAFGGET